MNTYINARSVPVGMPFLLVVVMGTSATGSAMTAFAVGVWAFSRTGSYDAYALIGLLSTCAVLTFAPLAGYVADRFPKRKILLYCDGLAICTVLVLATMQWLNTLTMLKLFAGVLLLAMAAEFRYTVTGALLYAISTREQLQRALSLQQVFRGLSIVGAPLLGAVLFDSLGLGVILLIDAVTFLLCVGVVLRLPVSTSGALTRRDGFRFEFLAGISWVARSPLHMGLLLVLLAFTTGMALFNVAIGPYTLSSGKPGDLAVTVSLMGGGMIAAGIALTAVSMTRQLSFVLFASALVLSSSLLAWGLHDHPWSHHALAFVIGGSLATLSSASQSLWQVSTPEHLQGKVLAARSMATYALSPLAILISMPVVESMLQPLISAHQTLQSLWGSPTQRSALGLFISLTGLALILVTGMVASRWRRAVDRPGTFSG